MNDEQFSTAIHEAGHCVAAHVQGLRVIGASAVPDPFAGDGACYWRKAGPELARAEIVAILAGQAAEQFFDESSQAADASDLKLIKDRLGALRPEQPSEPRQSPRPAPSRVS